jgi:hypothetical protein
MTAGASQVGIINEALVELGSTRFITSIEDSIAPAPSAKVVWDAVVRFMLDDHPWNWAIERATLNVAAPSPEFGFDYAYTLPADCLRWLPPAHEDGDAYFEGREEGGRLLTDKAAPIMIRYVSSTKGAVIAKWSGSFERAVSLEIAARLAEPITQDESIKDRTRAEAERQLRKAKRRDGLSSGHARRRELTARSDWLTARQTQYREFGR